MPRLDCTDAHADQDHCCPQIALGPFSCVAHHFNAEDKKDVQMNIFLLYFTVFVASSDLNPLTEWTGLKIQCIC